MDDLTTLRDAWCPADPPSPAACSAARAALLQRIAAGDLPAREFRPAGPDRMGDPLELEPATLHPFAHDGRVRHREGGRARTTDEGIEHRPPARGRRRVPVGRNRNRTVRNCLIGAASTAAVVAAAAAVIVSVPGQSAGRKAPAPSAAAPQAQTAAYVLQRAAAAEVNSYRLISVSHSQEPGSETVYTDVATQQQRTVADLRDSAGEPYFQITEVIKGGVWTYMIIDNQHHVYAIQTASARDHGFGAISISSLLPLQTQSDPAAAFQAALKHGIMTVVGHQNLGGRDTILIRVKQLTEKEFAAKAGLPKLPKGIAPPPSDEIWVDASTYQVVQTKTFQTNLALAPVRWTPDITRVSWLPATPGNLAKLTVTPPPGFTRVPYSDMVKYLGPIS